MELKKRYTVKFRSHCGDIYGIISSFFDLPFTGVPCVEMRVVFHNYGNDAHYYYPIDHLTTVAVSNLKFISRKSLTTGQIRTKFDKRRQ